MSQAEQRRGAVGKEVDPVSVFENGLPPVTPEEKAAWIALLKWRIDEYDPERHPSPVWSDTMGEIFNYEWLSFAVTQLDAEHAAVFQTGANKK